LGGWVPRWGACDRGHRVLPGLVVSRFLGVTAPKWAVDTV
jgi:hypothetical protein